MHRRALGTLVALGLALSACSDPSTPAPPPPTSEPQSETQSEPLRYVALGDSYSAAPGVPETSGADGCFRSSGNYAHLLTDLADDDLDLDLMDVTCSGATTSDVAEAQVPALTGRTDLVTIGIGGNDFDLFGGVLASCLSGVPCGDEARDQVDDLVPRIEDNVGALLDLVLENAPRAEVVVVGYPDLVPESGTCPDLLPLAAADYPVVDDATLQLTRTLQRQAEERDLLYLDVHAASQGHDICAEDPWVNGVGIAEDGTIPFHPFAAEQQAVAELLLEASCTLAPSTDRC